MISNGLNLTFDSISLRKGFTSAFRLMKDGRSETVSADRSTGKEETGEISEAWRFILFRVNWNGEEDVLEWSVNRNLPSLIFK